MTETSIAGTYSLVTVKESLPARRDKVIEHPYNNARFVFNNANEVACYIGADTLFGLYNFQYRAVPNGSNADGSSQTKRERGLIMRLTNFRNSRFIYLGYLGFPILAQRR